MSSEKQVSFLPIPSRHPARGASTSSSRQNTTPFAASPLHTTMSVATTDSESGSPPQQETPTPKPRSAESTRPRAHSRSSSAPTSLHVPRQRSDGASSRSTSPGLLDNRRSVKHLTCFWWKEKGTCRYSEEECLYAHRDVSWPDLKLFAATDFSARLVDTPIRHVSSCQANLRRQDARSIVPSRTLASHLTSPHPPSTAWPAPVLPRRALSCH